VIAPSGGERLRCNLGQFNAADRLTPALLQAASCLLAKSLLRSKRIIQRHFN
jgi:hypothetical protein